MEKKPKFKVGDKLYCLGYEENNASYTIIKVNEVKNDSYLPLFRAGIYYTVRFDPLPSAIVLYCL